MSRLKLVDAKTMEKVLFFLGFKRIRQKGSHVFYRHSDGRVTTIPFHKGRVLSRPLTRFILKEIDLATEQYQEILRQL